MSEGTVWLVETGEYEQRDVSIAFTSKALAKAHAKRVGGEAFGIPLFNRAVTYHPCYVRIAEVLRDGTVQQFAREEEWTEPGPQPLDKNSSLREIPGSIYGGRAIHIYVSGGDLSLVKAEFSRLIKLAQDSLSHAFP